MALESGSAALAWASSKPADDDGQVGQDLFPLGVEIDAVAVGSLDEFSQRFIPWMRHGTPRDGLADRGGQGTRAAPGLRQSPVPSRGVPGAGAGAPPGVISADLNQRVMYVYGADQSGSSRFSGSAVPLTEGRRRLYPPGLREVHGRYTAGPFAPGLAADGAFVSGTASGPRCRRTGAHGRTAARVRTRAGSPAMSARGADVAGERSGRRTDTRSAISDRVPVIT